MQSATIRSCFGFGRRGLTLLVLVAVAVLPQTGHAADDVDTASDANSLMPRCGPATDGQVYCKFGVVYECQLINPNSMERRTGWRWKSDILRSCARQTPATMDGSRGLPPIIPYVPFYTDDPCPPPGFRGARPSGHADGEPWAGTMHVHPDTGGCR